MNRLDELFRNRISFPENESITFETLDTILEKVSWTIPFENLAVINKRNLPLTQENLVDKILLRKEGGLCYEINPILYLFLLENGFDAVLTRGTIYRQDIQSYANLKGTHVAILLTKKDQKYLIDAGFGSNLPLTPVPLTGEIVTSINGEFRTRKMNSELGDYIFEMKLKHKDTDWRIGYAFDSQKPVKKVSECSVIQTVITEHPESPFNKVPLITKRTNHGNITLTDTTFTQWENGHVEKENINPIRFRDLAKIHFGL